MERSEKIKIMNSILALDEELSLWKAAQEKALEEENQSLRTMIQDLRETALKLKESELKAFRSDEDLRKAEALRDEGRAHAEVLRSHYSLERERMLNRLIGEVFG